MSNINNRLRYLEEAMQRANNNPAVVIECGDDDFLIVKPGHFLHRQHVNKTKCDEFISSLPEDRCLLLDFNPDSKAPSLETARQAMERLGPDWLNKRHEERQQGIVNVWYTDEEIIFEYKDGRKETARKEVNAEDL